MTKNGPCWGGLLVMVVLAGCMPSPRWVAFVERHNPGIVFSVPTEAPLVALTLDDGPHATLTPRLLDLLAEHDARATFFVMGDNVPGNEALVHRILEEGHELGHHMMTARPSIALGRARFEHQFARADSLLNAYGGARWFRPASGLATPGMLDIAATRGYCTVLGDVYPNDAQNPIVPLLADYILEHVRPGSVIILHDGLSWRVRTVHVLRRVLPELRRRGYRVVTLSELAKG